MPSHDVELKAQQDAEYARQLLANPLFTEVLGNLERMAVDRLIASDVSDISALQASVLRLQASRTFLVAIQRFVQFGEHEAKKLIDPPKSVFARFKK